MISVRLRFFHNETPFLCRGRLPATFRSRELMIESSRQVFYADTRINSAIQQIYHEIDDNNEGGDQYKDALNHGVIAVGDRSDQKIAHARNRKNLFQNNAVCHNICDCHAPEGQYRESGRFSAHGDT